MLPSMHGRWSEDTMGGGTPSGGSVFTPMAPRNNVRTAGQQQPQQQPTPGVTPMTGPMLPSRQQPMGGGGERNDMRRMVR